jgi:membrane glycosyltransferase
MLRENGLDALKVGTFILFVILLLPIALSFWTAVIGFVIQWRGRHSLDLTQTPRGAAAEEGPLPRTAVVMPVYNEDSTRVFAAVKATYESLERTGYLGDFDFFVLSDTTDPDNWVSEELGFAELRNEVRDGERLFYRNRRENTGRKMGNISEFCLTRGEQYRYMIVMDADSIMTGLCLVNLVRLMESNPDVGIVQAPPMPINRRTLFGRLHQFAARAYSLIFITGLNYWQGGAANYWGHNAIVRIAPFFKHCQLPELPGKEPLGGSILSHDFVEAAFLRRAGWKVYLASQLGGSYEEVPSSLVGYAARDRRWCQGNLQHARLLFSPGFHMVNRVHLLMGFMSYMASFLWLVLLGLTTAEGIKQSVERHSYFGPGRSLYPSWLISVRYEALALFAVMMCLLLLPKVLGLLIHWRKPQGVKAFGGGLRLALSGLCETLISSLLAPNLALLQARFVIGTLMGRVVEWNAQDRGETSTGFREAIRRHWLSTLLAVLWTVLLAMTMPNLLWWFSPVILGFLLAIPLSAWTSRVSVGEWARKHGLFLIPEELDPPDAVRRFEAELTRRSSTRNLPGNGLARVLRDEKAWEIHLSFLSATPCSAEDPLRQNYLEKLELQVQQQGPDALASRERRDLLLDPDALRKLRGTPVFS